MIRMTLVALAALFPAVASAQEGVTIRDAYARSTNPQTGAVFMVVENHGDTDCQLTSVSSAAAKMAELHTHAEVDGVMSMQKVEEGFAIPAGGEHMLARGGDHVMLMGLTRPLADGDSLTLTLDFGDCGTQQVEASVDNARTDKAEGGHMGH